MVFACPPRRCTVKHLRLSDQSQAISNSRPHGLLLLCLGVRSYLGSDCYSIFLMYSWERNPDPVLCQALPPRLFHPRLLSFPRGNSPVPPLQAIDLLKCTAVSSVSRRSVTNKECKHLSRRHKSTSAGMQADLWNRLGPPLFLKKEKEDRSS